MLVSHLDTAHQSTNHTVKALIYRLDQSWDREYLFLIKKWGQFDIYLDLPWWKVDTTDSTTYDTLTREVKQELGITLDEKYKPIVLWTYTQQIKNWS